MLVAVVQLHVIFAGYLSVPSEVTINISTSQCLPRKLDVSEG